MKNDDVSRIVNGGTSMALPTVSKRQGMVSKRHSLDKRSMKKQKTKGILVLVEKLAWCLLI